MPADATMLDTLGTAQFRAGMLTEAVRTLTQSNERLATAGPGASPTACACLAIAQHRLGATAAALAALAQMRELAAQPRYRQDPTTQAFVREAEAVFATGK